MLAISTSADFAIVLDPCKLEFDGTDFMQTWMYLAVPVVLYGCERLIRAFRSGYKSVQISKVG